MMTGEQLRARRLRLGLTQPAMAAYLGVSQWTIAQWEAGRRGISMDDILLRYALSRAEDAGTQGSPLPDWRAVLAKTDLSRLHAVGDDRAQAGQSTDDSTEGVGQ